MILGEHAQEVLHQLGELERARDLREERSARVGAEDRRGQRIGELAVSEPGSGVLQLLVDGLEPTFAASDSGEGPGVTFRERSAHRFTASVSATNSWTRRC